MQDLIITNAGKDLITRMIEGTTSATFTEIRTSDHTYRQDELQTLTALDDIKQTIQITSVERADETTVEIFAATDNSQLQTSYFIRALGVYARDGDGSDILFGVSIDENPIYLPAFTGKSLSSVSYQLSVKVDDAEQVNIIVEQGTLVTTDQLKRTAEDIIRSFVRREITIPKNGWQEGPMDEWQGYYLDLPVEDVSEEIVPFVSIKPPDADIAADCRMNSAVQSLNGKLRFYAEKTPTKDMSAMLTMIHASDGKIYDWKGSPIYELPPATTETLGGVIIGDYLKVQEDGTVSFDDEYFYSERVATDEEVAASIEAIFEGV